MLTTPDNFLFFLLLGDYICNKFFHYLPREQRGCWLACSISGTSCPFWRLVRHWISFSLQVPLLFSINFYRWQSGLTITSASFLSIYGGIPLRPMNGRVFLPFGIFHYLLAHPCRCPATFASFLTLIYALILSLEEVIFEYQSLEV